MTVNGQPCTVLSESAAAVMPPSGQAQTESAAKLTTRDGHIFGLDGQPLFIRGINYFGFETGNTFLDGFWSGGSHDLTRANLAASAGKGKCEVWGKPLPPPPTTFAPCPTDTHTP